MIVIDVVCLMNGKENIFVKYDHRVYHFCSLKCKNKFLAISKRERPVLELYNVGKTYTLGKAEVQAVRNATLWIRKGEFLSIQGPSGSGKSTLMHLVGCLDVPTQGRVFIDGNDIGLMHESELAQIRGRKIGFVFQQFNLIHTITALQNVMLPMTFQQKSEEEREKRAKELLELVGLKDRMYHRPTELSGGQQQRVAVARALANDPEIILADEPTGNLDSHTGHALMDMLRSLHEKFGKTLIIVTHDKYIAKYAKHKINILDGQIQHDHEHMREYLW